MKIVVFDTETSGLIGKDAKWWENKLEPYPYILSMAWSIIEFPTEEKEIALINFHDLLGGLYDYYKQEGTLKFGFSSGGGYRESYSLLSPYAENGAIVNIHPKALEANGLDIRELMEIGKPTKEVLEEFIKECEDATLVVGHNADKYDIQLTVANAIRFGLSGWEKEKKVSPCCNSKLKWSANPLVYTCLACEKTYESAQIATIDDRRAYKSMHNQKRFDTMADEKIKEYVGIEASPQARRYGKYKAPKLIELWDRCFNYETEGKIVFGAHNALQDVRATTMCFLKLNIDNII